MSKQQPSTRDGPTGAVALWVRDSRGRITLPNGGQHDLFLNETSKQAFLDRVHPDDRGQLQALSRAIQEGTDTPEIEYRFNIGTTGYRNIVERNLPNASDTRAPDQLVAVALDTTRHKKISQRLREHEGRFRDFSEAGGSWMWETDENLRFTYLSDSFFEQLGFAREDVIGREYADFIVSGGDAEAWCRHLEEVAHKRPLRAFRCAIAPANSNAKVIELNAIAVFDSSGSFKGYRGTGTDRTNESRLRNALQQSQRQFSDLVEGSIQGLYIHKDWRFLFANQALADMFGYKTPDDLLALESLGALFHPNERARLWGYKERREKGESAPEVYEARCLTKNGSLIWAEFRVKQVEWHGVSAMQCAVVDITERKNAEVALKQQNRRLRSQNERFNVALENMSQGLCMFDADEKLLVCNDRYIDMYDLPHELATPGTPFRKIIEHRIETGIYGGDDPEGYVEERMTAVREGHSSVKIQQLTDGRFVAIAHSPMPNGGWVATHEDITELQRVQDQIAHMAHHDALTDLPNRLLFRERIEQAVPAAKRDKGFAILCLDLDRFKTINDTLGHPIGDDLLKAVAERLNQCVRETDTVARLGGDEFAIIQPSDHQPQDATALARRICERIKEPFDLQEHQVVIDASIGIAVAPNDGLDADSLLKNADMALYRAKSAGRGIYRFFEAEMDEWMQARRRLELDLRKALAEDEFELYYQPLVNLDADEISGFEALLRWHHPERGTISPSEFIPIAEEIGLIVPLGEWVIHTACKQVAEWPTKIKVAVNLSPAQFRSENLVPTVFKALTNSGIAANRLELEITETVLLNDTSGTLEILHQLRDMGVRISMDDFGTGYSSLSYLRRFPFDKIKIDGSFVSDLSEQEGASAIVDAVASLSRSLGMATTAEGVETQEQLEAVRNAGYTEMQGYLFSPPLRAAEISERYYPTSSAKASA